MSNTFDVYTRVSDEAGREGPSFGSPAEQEAAGREWAEQNGVEVEEVVYDGDVTGEGSVEDRELGRLIRKIEAGESAGIIVRFIDRYARDTIEGALALDRIVAAGGRFVATANGFDSANLTPETKLLFMIQLAIAQAQRERNRESRLMGIKRAVERGVYVACRPPVGYVRNEDGSIVPHPELKELIREAFARRANGETAKSIADWLREAGGSIGVPNPKKGESDAVYPLAGITESGVRHLTRSRAYLGEAVVQSGVKGKPRVIANAHPPIVTEAEWERAQAAGGPYHPHNGKWSAKVRLGGIVFCQNGHRLKVGNSHIEKGGRVAAYTCTHANCDARATVQAEALDAWVKGVLSDAFLAREPHIVAIMEGDDRYQRALEAVEAARVELDTYRAEIKVSDVGVEQWKTDVAIRQAKVELARKALREIPAPKPVKKVKGTGKPMTFEEALPGLDREHNARFIARVVVKPIGKGKRVPVAERAEVYMVGAEQPLDVAAITPVGNPEVEAILAAAHKPEFLAAQAAEYEAELAAREAEER